MMPINAWVEVDLAQKLEDYGVETVYHSGKEGEEDPVTILPGHLAESLRWRKVGDEKPEAGKLYVVRGYGLCEHYVSEQGGTVDSFWWSGDVTNVLRAQWSFDLYRPAVAGLDYYVNEQSAESTS